MNRVFLQNSEWLIQPQGLHAVVTAVHQSGYPARQALQKLPTTCKYCSELEPSAHVAPRPQAIRPLWFLAIQRTSSMWHAYCEDYVKDVPLGQVSHNRIPTIYPNLNHLLHHSQ